MTDKVTQINIDFPDAADYTLKFSLGACRLRAASGNNPAWVTGTYTHTQDILAPKIEVQGGKALISQELNFSNIKGLSVRSPKFDLLLGKGKPYALEINAGAYEGDFDLGGLPITSLELKQGAGKMDFDFSAPNPQPMRLLEVEAGAVSLEMKNLANANFAEMTLKGGASSYDLHFGGTLQRNATVKITAGAASVELEIPASTAAKIIADTTLGGLDVGDGFMKKEGAFWTEAALAGKTPLLTIHASVAVGSLEIRTV